MTVVVVLTVVERVALMVGKKAEQKVEYVAVKKAVKMGRSKAVKRVVLLVDVTVA